MLGISVVRPPNTAVPRRRRATFWKRAKGFGFPWTSSEDRKWFPRSADGFPTPFKAIGERSKFSIFDSANGYGSLAVHWVRHWGRCVFQCGIIENTWGNEGSYVCVCTIPSDHRPPQIVSQIRQWFPGILHKLMGNKSNKYYWERKWLRFLGCALGTPLCSVSSVAVSKWRMH